MVLNTEIKGFEMIIKQLTIKKSFSTANSEMVLDQDIPVEAISEKYNHWRQDLLIKYFDPRW